MPHAAVLIIEAKYKHISDQGLYADKAAGGSVWRSLCGQKVRRKGYGSGRAKRGRIPHRADIKWRPKSGKGRTALGHWDGDTVIGKNHNGVLVTLVEGKSGYVVVRWAPSKDTE